MTPAAAPWETWLKRARVYAHGEPPLPLEAGA